MARLLLVLAMLVAVAVGFAGTLYLLPFEPAAESRSGDGGAPVRKPTPPVVPAAAKGFMDGLQTRFKSSDIANVEAGSGGAVRIGALGGMSEHYVAVGPLKAAASTSTLSLDLMPSPTSFVRIQLLDKANKGIFVDVDLDAAKVTIQRLEPIGRPTADLTKVDGDWRRLTIKGEFANEDRTIIVQLMKGLGATGFSPGGEGVSVKSMLLY